MVRLASEFLVLDFGMSKLKAVLYKEDFRESDRCYSSCGGYPAPLKINHSWSRTGTRHPSDIKSLIGFC